MFTTPTITDFFSVQAHDLHTALEQCERVRTELLSDVEMHQFVEPTNGRWRVEEILWHLHLVERGSASAIRRMLESERAEHISNDQLSALWTRMTRAILHRANTKIIAPGIVAPEGKTPSREECVTALHQSRERLRLHLQNATTEDLLSVYFPHPVLDILPGLYWVSFIGMHEARHLEQMRELIE